MIRPKIVAVFDSLKDTIDIMTTIYPEKNIKAENALMQAENRIDESIKKLNTHITKDDFIQNESKKQRPYPKKFDIAVPANMACGKIKK